MNLEIEERLARLRLELAYLSYKAVLQRVLRRYKYIGAVSIFGPLVCGNGGFRSQDGFATGVFESHHLAQGEMAFSALGRQKRPLPFVKQKSCMRGSISAFYRDTNEGNQSCGIHSAGVVEMYIDREPSQVAE
jgi:hypothetical protein